MIPAAEHIMQARGKDDMIVREVDCSLYTNEGWFSCGRYRTIEESPLQGYWLALSIDLDEEISTSLALCSKHYQVLERAKAIGAISPTVINSITYLTYGTIDEDVIEKLKVQDLIDDPDVTKIERLFDEDTSEES